MAAILQTLSGNPLATPIGQKIEQATDASLQTEDWSLNMEIIDMINDTDEGPKEAARAIKRRLQQNAGKNHTIVMYTLTLLETCVKNCGKRFHLLVTSKDFAQDLVKLIGPRNDPPLALQEKVLSLIQSWFDAFKSQPDHSGIVQVYSELKSKGIEFPASNNDSTALIYTPQRSASLGGRSFSNKDPNLNNQNVVTSFRRQLSAGYQTGFNSAAFSTPVNLTNDQLVKLRKELEIVNGNMKVFTEMLNEMTPGKEHEDDWKLLKDLNFTCQAMQKRIVELIEKVANEEITNELLRLNDELNYLFERFEKYERKKIQNLNSQTSYNLEPSLLDLSSDVSISNESDVLSNRLQSLNVAANTKTSAVKDLLSGGDADFDIFAQSRSSSIGTTVGQDVGTTAGAIPLPIGSVEVGNEAKTKIKAQEENSNKGLGVDNVDIAFVNPTQFDSERDLNEMEKWLLDQTACKAPASNVDFDQFLPKRTNPAQPLFDQSNSQSQVDEKKPKPDPFGL